MADLSNFAAMARRLLAKYGADATLEVVSAGTADLVAGTTTTPSRIAYPVKAALQGGGSTIRTESGELVRQSRHRAVIDTTRLATGIVPRRGWRLTIGGTTYTLGETSPVIPDGVTCLVCFADLE